MAVFNTNLIIHTGTDFEQTFVLEDDRTNSAKDLTGYTGVAKFKAFPNAYSTGDGAFDFSFTNRGLGKIRITMTIAAIVPPLITPCDSLEIEITVDVGLVVGLELNVDVCEDV